MGKTLPRAETDPVRGWNGSGGNKIMELVYEMMESGKTPAG